MNYKKIYDQLVAKAKPRGLDRKSVDYYTEIHHIVPKCLGGDNSEENLVMFSAKEHYIAHLILARLNPDVQGLTYAAFMMARHSKGSRVYESLRNAVAVHNLERNFGRLKTDYTGHKIGRLTVKEYIVDFMSGSRRYPKWRCVCDCGNVTYVATPYLKKKEIQSCGCLLSESSRNKALGKQRTKEVRDKISAVLKAKNLKPWENYKLDSKQLVKWLQADHFFSFWEDNSKPKGALFVTKYNKQFGTNYKRSHLKVMVKYFIDGWNPSEDPEWIKFKNSEVANE